MIKKAVLLSFLIIIFTAIYSHSEVETGWISGRMMIKGGGPMSNGMIAFFDAQTGPPPSLDKYFRVPDGVDGIDAEGRFRTMLPVGRYYLGAIKRVSGDKAGPPQDGDYFIISEDKAGNPRQYLIEKDKELNIGVIADAVPYKRRVPEDATGISGTVHDMAGSPVEGAIVFAYYTETMTGIPPFTSYKTGKDGKYIITVDRGGRYYLRVRDVYGGGPPVPGAIMGGYGEEMPAPVTVKTGELTGNVDIKVIRHMEKGPGGRQPEAGAARENQQEQKKKP
ncbi:MAG: carboxypeptidase regulatory-like domain-containing protein [Nitrospirae bacterium]|nr:carboxypeptidase regulatory-like domain-containing protein [Nitrospirota bacterium]